MDFSGLKDKLMSVLTGLKEALMVIPSVFKNAFASLSSFFSQVFKGEARFPKPPELLSRFRAIFTPEQKRFRFLILGGCAALFLILVIVLIAGSGRKSRENPGAIARSVPGSSIADEYFAPGEPDFIPEFIPTRERRRFWSLEDIRRYWKVPGNSGRWKEEITSTVDRLMESVP
jgi:hypothetical protein